MTTKTKRMPATAQIQNLFSHSPEMFKGIVKEALEEIVEKEMSERLGAAPGERTESRLGYRSGHYRRGLVTCIDKLELRVPRDREGCFSTELFSRYQRSEKALVPALAEMSVQGVSRRKVKAITEELCGHSFSASTISERPQPKVSTRRGGREALQVGASKTRREAQLERVQPRLSRLC